MARAFPIGGGKAFPRSLADFITAVRGGIIADSVLVTSGGSPVVLDVSVYEHKITSGGTAGQEILQLPAGTKAGQRVLITFDVEGNASDVVEINPGGGLTLEEIGYSGETPTAVTDVDLDTPGEYALFEFDGGTIWHLLYTDGDVT